MPEIDPTNPNVTIERNPAPWQAHGREEARSSAPFVVSLESSKWLVYSFQLEARTPRSRSCGRFGSRRLARLKFSR
jgi:hypothetical protein